MAGAGVKRAGKGGVCVLNREKQPNYSGEVEVWRVSRDGEAEK